MNFPLVFVFLFLAPVTILGEYANFRDDLNFDDLVKTRISCAKVESCTKVNPNPFQIQRRTCSCMSDCPEFGTCCIDSPYRDGSVPKVECRNVKQTFSKYGYFLVFTCPPQVGGESPWKDLCEGEWNGEDDMMKLAPVSSLDTLVTYKNYYCFRCHEDSDRFKSWDLRISSNSVDENRISEDFSITYDGRRKSWIATTGDEYVLENIDFQFIAPGDITPGDIRPKDCLFIAISDCHAAWTDEDTREKCAAYTSVVYSRNNASVSYKNFHCALCNFEDIGHVVCAGEPSTTYEVPIERFSFAHLLNIHRDNTDKSENKKCEKNQLWDPYGRRCRRIACAIPGYVVKQGRCTRP